MKSAREDVSRAGRPERSQPGIQGGPRLLCYLELYGSPRLLLDNRRSISNPAARAYFVDVQFDQITRAKFAIYRQIKEGKVSPHLGDLQSHANGPNVLGQKRFFLSDKQSLVPRSWAPVDRTYGHRESTATRPPRRSIASVSFIPA